MFHDKEIDLRTIVCVTCYGDSGVAGKVLSFCYKEPHTELPKGPAMFDIAEIKTLHSRNLIFWD